MRNAPVHPREEGEEEEGGGRKRAGGVRGVEEGEGGGRRGEGEGGGGGRRARGGQEECRLVRWQTFAFLRIETFRFLYLLFKKTNNLFFCFLILELPRFGSVCS